MARWVIFSLSLLLLAACGESGSQTGSGTLNEVKTSALQGALKGKVRLVLSKSRNTVDECFPARPKGATQMTQYGVAVLGKDLPFPAGCALF